MVKLKELVAYMDDLLEVHRFKDYCPNGLQVEGCAEVGRLISGVTASQALINTAIEKKAHAILAAVGSGQLPADMGRDLLSSLSGVARVAEIDELEQRITALEQQNGSD